MASRRKRRGAETYVRRGATREPYQSVLIVCEGGKTEPNYFNGLRKEYRLSSANIKITPAGGTDPMSIVSFAEREIEREEYDRIFCVFDRDNHNNYNAAVRRTSELDHFEAITSWPCFEVWVLLHFLYSSAPFERAGQLSACDKVFKKVKKHFPTYTKSHRGVFDDLAPKLDDAIRHARRLAQHNRQSGSVNPATKIHKLVNFLIKLKK